MACYKCHTEAAGYVENTHAKRRFCSAKCQSRYYEIGGAADGKVLPPIPYPRHSLLIVKQYRGKDIYSYGTAFVRDLMVQEGLPTEEFDSLLTRLAAIRRAMLSEYIDRIEKNEFERHESLPESFFAENPDHKWKVHEFLITPWLSPDLYKELIPYVNDVAKAVGDNQRNALLVFIKRVLPIDEYLLNWRSFSAVIGMRGYPKYNDAIQVMTPLGATMSSVFDTVVRKRRQESSTKFSIDAYAPRVITTLSHRGIRRVPKGTLVYRGFKTYRKPLDQTLDYAYFAMDMINTLAYLAPEMEPDPNSPSTLVSTATMDAYCPAIGGTAVFELKQDIDVLDFGDVKTIQYVYNLLTELRAPDEVVAAAHHGWKLSDDASRGFTRHSVDPKDRLVAQWLCHHKFGGYIAAAVKGLHDEMMLCNVHTLLDYLGFYEPAKDMNFPICNAPYTEFNCRMEDFC
jgi:hypothetical protein